MTSDTRREIESANAQFMSAFKRSDATAIGNLYTTGARLLPANSDFVRGTAAIRAFWQNVMNMGLKSASLETIEVEAHGDTAIEVGRYRLLAAGDALVDHGKLSSNSGAPFSDNNHYIAPNVDMQFRWHQMP